MTASNRAIVDFEATFAAFAEANAEAIWQAQKEAAKNPDAIDDLYWEAIDNLKSSLGAAAANSTEDEAQQEVEISSCEKQISKMSLDPATLVLWQTGTVAGALAISLAVAPAIV